MSISRLVYVELDCHFCSRGVPLMGNEWFEVVVWISYSFLVKRVFRLWVIWCKLVV